MLSWVCVLLLAFSAVIVEAQVADGLCLLCAANPLQSAACAPIIDNCKSPGCADCLAGLKSGSVRTTCVDDAEACRFITCGFASCPTQCPQTIVCPNVTQANITIAPPRNYTTCDPSGGTLCADSDRLCDPNNASDTFPACNFCDNRKISWQDGRNGCLNFGFCYVQDATALAAQAGVTVANGSFIPICTCQPPYIPPQCKLNLFQYFNAESVYNGRWYFFVCCCLAMIGAAIIFFWHLYQDKKRYRTIQQGTRYHMTGLCLVFLGAMSFAIHFGLNFEGTWYGGYNDNFGWIYVTYLFLNLGATFAVMEVSLIAGQWLSVFFVFKGLASGKVVRPRPVLAYYFAGVVGFLSLIVAFVLAWAATVRPVGKYVLLQVVIVNGSMSVLVAITASYAMYKFKNHAAKMESFGRSYTEQTKKFLIQTGLSIGIVTMGWIVSIITFSIPDATYATLGGNIYVVSLYLPLVFQAIGWVSLLLLHSRAKWKIALLNTKVKGSRLTVGLETVGGTSSPNSEPDVSGTSNRSQDERSSNDLDREFEQDCGSKSQDNDGQKSQGKEQSDSIDIPPPPTQEQGAIDLDDEPFRMTDEWDANAVVL